MQNTSVTQWETIRDITENPRGAVIVGHWPTEGYIILKHLKVFADDNHFIGLAIDVKIANQN